MLLYLQKNTFFVQSNYRIPLHLVQSKTKIDLTFITIELLIPRLTAIAVFPYTTACSPWRITFPGAETLTVYELSIPLNIFTIFFWKRWKKNYLTTVSLYNVHYYDWFFHCSVVRVFCVKAWIVFSSSWRTEFTNLWKRVIYELGHCYSNVDW